MPIATKTRLALACATGGTCAISAPIAFHFSRGKSGHTTELKEEAKELTQVGTSSDVHNETIGEGTTDSYPLGGGEEDENSETTRDHNFKNTKKWEIWGAMK